MNVQVKLPKELVDDAKKFSKVLNRSIEGQIEHWAKIGKIAEENPELSYEFIKDALLAHEEAEKGEGEPYVFGES